MGSFYDVVNGNQTKATDVNQLVDALNGSTAAALTVLATSNTAASITGFLPSAPPTNPTAVVQATVSGDSQPRAALMINPNGYGEIAGGIGGSTATSAHLLASSTGWVVVEAIKLDNGAITTDGSGNLSSGVGNGIPMTRNGGAVSVPIFTGATSPSSPPTGSIWIKA